jgi:hypothetical protein
MVYVSTTGSGMRSSHSPSAWRPGIIFDATVIRALLVPALMRLLGELSAVR